VSADGSWTGAEDVVVGMYDIVATMEELGDQYKVVFEQFALRPHRSASGGMHAVPPLHQITQPRGQVPDWEWEIKPTLA
jgi:hypothetical protein